MKRAFAILVALSACKHGAAGSLQMDIRNASSSTRSRSFEWVPQHAELDAFSPQGRMLQLWVHPSRLQVIGQSDVTVPEGCRGGYLTQNGASGQNLIEIIICPARPPAPGWSGWHADLYVYGDAALGSVPPKLDFAVKPDESFAAMDVGGRNFRAHVVVPNGPQGDVVRAVPELYAFAIVTGVVP